MRSRRGWILGALLGLGISGAAGATAGPPSRPPPPRAYLEDPDYRIRLLQPGPTWTLLDEGELAVRAPGAILGAAGPSGTFGSVSVMPAPAMELETFARQHVERLPSEDRVVEPVRHGRYQGHPSLQVEARYALGRVGMLTQVTCFLREGQLFVVDLATPQAVALATSSPYAALPGWDGRVRPPDAADVERTFRAFHESLEVLPGAVRPRELAPARDVDARGVGWRIERGTFRSAISGLRIAPPPGWSYVFGTALLAANPEAEIGLFHARTGAVVLLLDEPASRIVGARYEAFILGQIAGQLGAAPAGTPRHATFLGADLELHRFPLTSPFLRELACGARATARRAHQVQVYAPQTRVDAAWEVVPALLAGITELGEDARSGLVTDLAGAPDPQDVVAPDVSLRAGVWRLHRLGLSFRKPSSSWRILLGSEVPGVAGLIVYAHDRERGVSMRILRPDDFDGLFATTDDPVRHRSLVARVLGAGAAQAPVETLELGTVPAWRSSTSVEVDAAAGLSQRLDLVSLRWQGSTLAVLLTGPSTDDAKPDADFAAVLSRLSFASKPAPEVPARSTRFEDARLGFAFTCPEEQGWAVRDETSEGLRPAGVLVHAVGPQQSVVVAAFGMGSGSGAPERVAMEQVTRLLGARGLGFQAAEGTEERLGGLPAARRAYRLGAQRLEILTAHRGPLLYMLFFASRPDGSGLSLDEAKRGFELLP